MNDVQVSNPFGGGQVANAPPTLRIEEQRAIAEVQAAALVARATPRDPKRAVDMILIDAQRVSLAEHAIYEYSRGGSEIEGASIRLIEAVARRWTNISAGVAQLYVHENKSFCKAWAIDLESNFREERFFVVPHERHTRNGSYALTDERDIRELWLNIGARHKRSCIQALIDGDVIAAAMEQCKRTLSAHGEVTPERLQAMVAKFDEVGVTRTMIERRIQRSLDSMSPATLLKLGQIYNALRDGVGQVTDYFVSDDVVDMPAGQSRTEQAKEKVRARTGKGKAEAPAPKPKAAGKVQVDDVTYAQVADAMQTAKTAEAVSAAADGIQYVKDAAQRAELETLLEARLHEFEDAKRNDPLGDA